jgi:hypothetical protein
VLPTHFSEQPFSTHRSIRVRVNGMLDYRERKAIKLALFKDGRGRCQTCTKKLKTDDIKVEEAEKGYRIIMICTNPRCKSFNREKSFIIKNGALGGGLGCQQ